MEEVTWYDVFIENLYEKCSKKSQLAQELMDLLCIEREAVYRRLRKEVVFPVHEMVKIASEWGISLDEIVGINSGQVPFRLQPINYFNPSKKEMGNMQKRIRAVEYFSTLPDSEHMEVCNKIPKSISTGSLLFYRFKIFNWTSLYNNDDTYKRFSDIILPEKVREEIERYSIAIKSVANSSFILDNMVLEHLIRNIQYFHSILLITDEEKELLRKELHVLLDYLLEIANNGCYPETQNKVNLYISQLNIDTNYSYYYSEQMKSCLVQAFGKFDIASYDSDMVNNFRAWMNIKKRATIQISEVNEKFRIEFFTQQRQIVDTL